MSRTRSGSFATADSRAAQRSNHPAQRKVRRRSRSAGYSEALGRSPRPRLRVPAREAAKQPPSPPGRAARRLRGRLPAEASSQPCAATMSASIAPPRPRGLPSSRDPTPARARTRGSPRHRVPGRPVRPDVSCWYIGADHASCTHGAWFGPEAAALSLVAHDDLARHRRAPCLARVRSFRFATVSP
jgi:hypothetical protein